jgi:hypothetical protein
MFKAFDLLIEDQEFSYLKTKGGSKLNFAFNIFIEFQLFVDREESEDEKKNIVRHDATQSQNSSHS